MSYNELFLEAIARAGKFDLATPSFTLRSNKKFLTKAVLDQLPYYLHGAVGELDFPDVVAQCHSIHYRLKKPLEELFDCEVYYTIGWVQYAERNFFEFDEDYIRELLKGPLKNTLGLHVWLTLPSMEIIDISLPTSFGILQNKPEMNGLIIARMADEMVGMAYIPVLVGDDLLKKAGYILSF